MIAIASDHRGYKMKEEIKKYFQDHEIEYKDYGTFSEERVDYPEKAKEVALAIQEGKVEKGILICGTGLGMSIAANKFKGIRCTVCYSEDVARYAKKHNDSNILALGAEVNTISQVIEIIRVWLATEFEGERHKRRIEMIKEIENKNFK